MVIGSQAQWHYRLLDDLSTRSLMLSSVSKRSLHFCRVQFGRTVMSD